MKLGANLAAIVLLVIGVIWILQGANLLGGSFMTGQSLWLYIGIAVTAASLAILIWLNMR